MSKYRDIFHTTLEMCMDDGYLKVTRDKVAKKLKISPSLINYHFGSYAKLMNNVLNSAIKAGNSELINQMRANHDRRIKK
jgi:AcrR family transcriptional regulator